MSKIPHFVKPMAVAVALASLLGACAVYVPGPGPGYYGGGGYHSAPYYRGYYGRPYFR